jgi:hypothetical protein
MTWGRDVKQYRTILLVFCILLCIPIPGYVQSDGHDTGNTGEFPTAVKKLEGWHSPHVPGIIPAFFQGGEQ